MSYAKKRAEGKIKLGSGGSYYTPTRLAVISLLEDHPEGLFTIDILRELKRKDYTGSRQAITQVLSRLERDGFIKQTEKFPSGGGRQRRYYTIDKPFYLVFSDSLYKKISSGVRRFRSKHKDELSKFTDKQFDDILEDVMKRIKEDIL